MTNSQTYPEAWERTVSRNTRWIVSMIMVLAPIVSVLANSIVLTDILTSVLSAFGAPLSIVGNRGMVVLILNSLILFPLCIQKNLANLKTTSAIGLAGHFSCMAVFLRRIKDGSYATGGQFYAGSKMATMAAAATKKKAVPLIPNNSMYFTVASVLMYCLVTHYNAPKYYNELKADNKGKPQLAKMAFTSYFLGALTYIGSFILGCTLFGSASESFALNSLSINDPLALFARMAFGSSVLATTPLIFISMRNWFIERIPKFVPSLKGKAGIVEVTIPLLAMIGYMAANITDVAMVAAFAGSVFGSTMMFVLPPIMYMRAVKKKNEEAGKKPPILTMLLNLLLLAGGSAFGTAATMNTMKTFGFL
jgi:sodium-coupled neutral amino acid transporter 11